LLHIYTNHNCNTLLHIYTFYICTHVEVELFFCSAHIYTCWGRGVDFFFNIFACVYHVLCVWLKMLKFTAMQCDILLHTLHHRVQQLKKSLQRTTTYCDIHYNIHITTYSEIHCNALRRTATYTTTYTLQHAHYNIHTATYSETCIVKYTTPYPSTCTATYTATTQQHAHAYTHTHTHVNVCTYVRMYAALCICIYIYFMYDHKHAY